MIKIGIPKALFYYRHPKLWVTFFQSLGFKVVFSPATNREIMTRGTSLTDNEACLPAKIINGHIDFLKDKTDYIFIPRYISLKKGKISCPKMFALPDVASSTFTKLPPLVSPEVNLDREKWPAIFKESTRGLPVSAVLVKTAGRKALAAESQNQQLKHELFTRKIGSPRPKIIIVSHPYNVYDNFVNRDLLTKIEERGFEALPIDATPTEKHSKTVYHWDFIEEIFQAIKNIDPGKIAGVLQLSTFNCGCDSFMAEFIEAEFQRQKTPYTKLIIDEHSGEAGIVTRIEAFLDTL